MANTKTTASVRRRRIESEFVAINARIIDALRLLHAAGVLERSDDGWTYTTSAYVSLPVDSAGLRRSPLVHWASGQIVDK